MYFCSPKLKIIMKNLLKLSVLCIAIIFTSCSTEPIENSFTENNELENLNFVCSNSQAGARITNNGDLDVNLEIYDSNGILVGFVYNLSPGESSSWFYFDAGVTTFDFLSSDGALKAIVQDMNHCSAYDMEVGENNHIVSDAIEQF